MRQALQRAGAFVAAFAQDALALVLIAGAPAAALAVALLVSFWLTGLVGGNAVVCLFVFSGLVWFGAFYVWDPYLGPAITRAAGVLMERRSPPADS